jgi:xyloglucan-specific exo-beta-1,4-glucanase
MNGNSFNPNVKKEWGNRKIGKQVLASLLLLAIIFVFECNYMKAQTTADYKWNTLPIGGGGFVSGIITSKKEKNLIYVRTDVGGAYRWNASTSTWIPLLDWCSEDELGYQGVEALAIDPQSPKKLYMLAGTSYFNNGKTVILRSDDYGNTFTVIDVTSQFKANGNGMGRQTGERLAVDPNNGNILYCGTRENGLFKSTDAGSTWSRLNSLDVKTTTNGNGICFVVLDGSSVSNGATQRVIVGVSRSGSTNLYRSDDGGASFSAVSGATTDYMPHRAALASDGDLYITYGNGCGPNTTKTEAMDKGQIWKYKISNGALTDVTPSNFGRAFGGISVDPNNSERLVACSINAYWTQYHNKNITDVNKNGVYGDRIFLSTDGGSSWVDVVDRGFTMDTDGVTWIYGHAIHWAGSIEFDPFNTERVLITSGNGLFVNDKISSSDTWRFLVKGLEETVAYDLVSIPDGPAISVIGDYDGFRHTDNTKYAPIHNPQMGTTTGLTVAAKDTKKMFRVGSKMYYSTDMGVSWTQSSMNGNKGKVALSADGKTVLHSPEKSSDTYRSTDNGASWAKVSGLSFNEARPVGDPVNSTKFYTYNSKDGAVMVSTNGGSSFSKLSTVSSYGSKNIRVAPGREGDLWIPLYDNGLTRSTDAGKSFSTISGISKCGAVGFGKAASGANYPTIFIWGTINNVEGIYRSTDQGASWVRVNDDAHEYGGPANGQFVNGDMNVFGRVYMSTAGRGIVFGTPNCTPSTITPYAKINSGSWKQTASASLSSGDTLMFGPQPVKGGKWSWSGPNEFSSSTREVYISNIQANQAGDYVATYTNDGGCQSTQTFDVTVTAPCTSTDITPYVKINSDSWKQTASASLASGDDVVLGPQPVKGGTWSWSGPNEFTSSTREVNISNIQANQAGDYVATYTNDDGCQSTKVFDITVGAATGTILREYWTGISGTAISDLTSNTNYPNTPSGSEQLTSLEGATNWADNYGTRIRGYIHPTTSGSYTFWVAGDDNVDLYLSTDDTPANSSKIAYVSGWTNSKVWDKYSTQQSAAINLVAGQKYYIEVLHKEGGGGDNVAVAWQGPGISQQVIDGSYLSPFVQVKSALITTGISPDEENLLSNMILYPNPASNGKFNIDYPGIKGTVTIGIYDIQGNLVYKQSETGKEHMVVNSNLVNGFYLVKVQSETSAITRRLVIK